jgi:glycosyltransferase involved in cell wall biosynthesis
MLHRIVVEPLKQWHIGRKRAYLNTFKAANTEAQTQLVMTLLVRNEVDVIEGNLRFHLDHGVDFIVATDNGSSDGTTEILEEYVKKGVVHLIHESSRVFQQRAWVNRMGKLAYSTFAADAIFHADADEIWYPASGSLKHELSARKKIDVLSVPVKNMLLTNKNGLEQFPDDVAYKVNHPLKKSVRTVMNEVDQQSFLLYRHPCKTLYRTRMGYMDVVQGNHDICPTNKKRHNVLKKASHDIEVLHFPVRGIEQFFRKTLNNGEGLENLHHHSGSDAVQGWHVKRWYALYKEGTLNEEYQRLIIDHQQLEHHLKKGVLFPLSEQAQQVLAYFNRTTPASSEASAR